MKHSIKLKLFIIFILILMLNILFTFFTGTALFERLYTQSRTDELKKGADQIRTAYRVGQDFQALIQELENKNATVALFSKNNNEIEFSYFSRPFRRVHNSTLRFFINSPDFPIQFRGLSNPETYKMITGSNEFYVGSHGVNISRNSIYLLGHVKDNIYIFADTPTEYIKNTADLAVKYVLYISILTFLAGAVIIYFTADKISKPIREIQTVTDKISVFDFSSRCEINSNDEIGRLAQNINNMSDKIQENISRIIEANKVLQEDLKRQEETDNMRKQFIANVSHDFKTPLTLIVSYAEALRDLPHEGEETRREYCDIVIDEGNKMSELVQMLLKLSQLESGMIKASKTIFSINEIIIDIIKKHKLLLEKKQISIEKTAEDSFIVFADYHKIDQVITNLFENAIKYAPIGGEIKISLKKSEKNCRICVFNSGSHIDESELENIFISFYRTDISRSRDMQSYGLGLAIVKAIMDMHNQSYGALNKDGGVEFWFELEIVDLDYDE